MTGPGPGSPRPTGTPPPPASPKPLQPRPITPRPKYREWPYVGLLLLGCLTYGSALGVLLGEWASRS